MARTSLMAASSSSSSSLMVVLLLVVPSVFGTDHTVGGNAGWSLSGSYDSWASGQTFTVGDNLVFTYDNTHSVDTVNENDYNSCTSGTALKTYTGGNTKIPLTTAGKMYFICPTAGHCGSGMKLAIDVVAASGSTPATPSTPKSPSTPSTPATTSPTTASPPPPAGNGAVGGFLGVKQLMGSLVVSLLILTLVC